MLVSIALALAACDGPVEDPFAEHPDGVNDQDPAAAAVQPSAPMVRNLSNREYLSAISDLTGQPIGLDIQKAWTPTTQFGGFDAVAWTNIDTKSLRDRAEALETILDRAVTSPKVMTCAVTTADGLTYAKCAQSILERIGSRGFGRPLAPEETAALASTYEKAIALAKGTITDPGALFREGVRGGLGSIFLAPQFLTRSEAPPTPDFEGERDLDAYELANRLSFMFLGSIPDDQLWEKAQDGSLARPEVLRAEAERLIDEKTDTFVQSFMGQWFDFRAYDDTDPKSIERAMWNESWRMFADVIKGDMAPATILSPGYTYLNRNLAAHYGIPGQFGDDDFQKVTTSDRGGVLQQGSWLSLSATPLKTSPIHRGRMVQDRLLCKAIPPPDSSLFAKIQQVSAGIPQTATVKERLQAHRTAGDACFGCHKFMDPIGLGLESFDQFGKVRTQYADGRPVEASSDILGKPFSTVNELGDTIATLPEFNRCVSEKLSIFSLRTSEPAAELLNYLGGAEGMRSMVLRLVTSHAFRRVNHGGAK